MKKYCIMVSMLSTLVNVPLIAMEVEEIEEVKTGAQPVIADISKIEALIAASFEDFVEHDAICKTGEDLVTARGYLIDRVQKLERSVRSYEEALANNRERLAIYETHKQLCETFLKHNEEAIVSLKEQRNQLPKEAEPVQVLTESIYYADVTVEQEASNECFSVFSNIREELKNQSTLRKKLNLKELSASLEQHLQAAQSREAAIMQKLKDFNEEIQRLKQLKANLHTAILGLNDRYQTTVVEEIFVQSVLEQIQIDQSFIDVPRNQPAVDNQQNESSCQIL